MSEPTTTAVPKSEDKTTEVTPAVEPTPEPVVETPAPVSDAPKEDVKAGEPTNTETPQATDKPAEPKESNVDDKPASGSPKEARPKSPSFFLRLLTRVKGGDKKKAPGPVAEEPTVPAEEPSPADAKPEETPAVEPTQATPAPADPVKETEVTPAPAEPEVPVPSTTDKEPKNGDGKKENKDGKHPNVARRLSGRFVGFFQPQARRKDAEHPPKVEEAPPMIEEPTPVAPLENPAADSPAKDKEVQPEVNETNEPPKIIETTPAPVAATA